MQWFAHPCRVMTVLLKYKESDTGQDLKRVRLPETLALRQELADERLSSSSS